MHIRNARIHNCGVSNLDLRSKGLLPKTKDFIGYTIRSLSHTLGERSYSHKNLLQTATAPPDANFHHTAQRLSSMEATLNRQSDTLPLTLPQLKKPPKLHQRSLWQKQRVQDMYPTVHKKREKKLRKVGNLLDPKQQEMLNRMPQKVSYDLKLPFGSPPLVLNPKKPESKAQREGRLLAERVNQLRKMLKLRYGDTNNLIKVFKGWDAGLKGYLDANDIYTMMNQVGIKCSKDQAGILMACADLNNDRTISSAEFKHMIISYDDQRALDPKTMNLQAYSVDQNINHLQENFRNQEKNLRKIKYINQLKFIIKNKMQQATLEFKTFDRAVMDEGLASSGINKSLTVNFDGFCKALNRLNLPATLHENKEIYQDLFNEFKGGANGPDELQYPYFFNQILHYEYDPFQAMLTSSQPNPQEIQQYKQSWRQSQGREYKRGGPAAGMGKSKSGGLLTSGRDGAGSILFKIDDPKTMGLIDRKSASYNMLERLYGNTKKVIQSLKRSCGIKKSKDALSFLESKINLINEDVIVLEDKMKNKFEGKVAKMQDFEACLKQALSEEIKQGRIEKRDLTGFFSSFTLNPKYSTFFVKNFTDMIDMNDNQLMAKVFDASHLGPPPPKIREINEEKVAQNRQKLKKKMEQIKFKMAQQSTDPVTLFWKFDPDRDGYASYQDMARTFKTMLLCKSEDEGLELATAFDPSLKGYMTFDNFIKAFELHEFVPEVSIYCPDRDHAKRHLITNSQTNIKKQFLQNNVSNEMKVGILQAPTRFGRTKRPQTFANFQDETALKKPTPLKNRCQIDPVQSKVSFQQQQKYLSRSRSQAIQNRKRVALQDYVRKLDDAQERRVDLYKTKIEKIAQRKQMYEALNH